MGWDRKHTVTITSILHRPPKVIHLPARLGDNHQNHQQTFRNLVKIEQNSYNLFTVMVERHIARLLSLKSTQNIVYNYRNLIMTFS